MKYLIMVPDGAADEKIEKLNGKTPLDVADMPTINGLASKGEVGLVQTIPDGVAPGSDAANLSVMGYDPSIYLTGRSPLEAASIGIDMSDTDVAFRTNLITLKEPEDCKNPGETPYEQLLVWDHSSGDISNEEAKELIDAVENAFGNDRVHFYAGVSYRHAMIVNNGSTDYVLTPPHDILTKAAGDYLPKGKDSQFITDIMKASYKLLKDHPVNKKRIEKGLNPANSVWIWGQGKKPNLSSFYDKYKIDGATISAVDLIKGIGICAGLKSIDVEGATGTLHTNFKGKAQATIKAFKDGEDFVYLHLEAPDECSHQGDMEGKIKALEIIDRDVLKPIVEYLDKSGEDFKIMILPDHRTPLAIRTHSSTAVPYVIYEKNNEKAIDTEKRFSEDSGTKGDFFESGYKLTDYFFK